VLGGFGNIAGHIEFWDNNRKKSIASIKAPGSTAWAWSPCSRFFLTATLFPRLRVDNGFKVRRSAHDSVEPTHATLHRKPSHELRLSTNA
jgi:uncharacterized protein with WD repeat